MEEMKFCFAQFKIRRQTQPGEEIYITGDTAALGNWNIQKAERMVTSKQEYPLWKTKENIKIPQNTEIEYKYLIFKNGKFSCWEKTENNANRKIKIENYFRVVILDPGSKIERFTQALPAVPGTPSLEENNDLNFDLGCDNNIIEDRIQLRSAVRKSSKNYPREKDELSDIFPDLNCDIDSDDNNESDDANEHGSSQGSENDQSFDQGDQNEELIICAFYLPINACKSKTGEWRLEKANEPLYHTLNLVTQSNKKIKWVGVLKNYYKIKDENTKKQLVEKLRTDYNMFAIDIGEEMFNTLFILFNSFIEPLFHYVTLRNYGEQLDIYDQQWSVYRTFNEIVAKTLLEIMDEDSLIFINDYQFFLVPSLLYSICSNFKQINVSRMSIGYFIHVPFPSYEMFKFIPYREEILKSMMNCAVIGFHTFDSSTNFIRTAKRIISVDYESTLKGDLALSYLGRKVIIRVSNITPEQSILKSLFDTDEFRESYNELRKKHSDKFIFASIDNVQFLSTMRQKIEGFRRFLNDIGDEAYRKKLVFLQYIKVSSDDVKGNGEIMTSEEANEALNSIKELTAEINKEFPNVLELVIKPITYGERLALFAASNCFVRTSKRESYSLGIYEFLLMKIYTKQTKNVEYMITQLSGVTTTLAQAIKINPYDTNSFRNGFMKAFTGYIDEKEYIEKTDDFAMVQKSSASEWINNFRQDIRNGKNYYDTSHFLQTGTGLGLKFRLMKTQIDFREIIIEEALSDYENANSRLILFSLSEPSSQPALSLKLLQLLSALSSDTRNSIYFISSSDSNTLDEVFLNIEGFSNNFTLVSENGYSSRALNSQTWTKNKNVDTEWTSLVKNMLQPYAEHCEGSTIITKESTVIWNYSDSDIEQGKLYANTITNELTIALRNENFSIRQNEKAVVVNNKSINKGNYCSKILKKMIRDAQCPDFVIAIGDEFEDEILFKYLNKRRETIKGRYKCKGSATSMIYTVVIGKKPSNATEYIGINSLKKLLDLMGKASTRKISSRSTMNMQAFMPEEELAEKF